MEFVLNNPQSYVIKATQPTNPPNISKLIFNSGMQRFFFSKFKKDILNVIHPYYFFANKVRVA